MQHADGSDHIGFRRRAPFDIQRQFGHRAGRVTPAAHRRGAGMAGLADDFADIAQAAIDGRDHAQGQVQLVQHRALFDVHFNEAEVVRGVTFFGRNGRHRGRQAGSRHRLLHRHTIGILLLQPRRVEVTRQRAAAQKSRLVALAFFFGKAHHLNAQRQALPGGVQLGHHGHGQQNAQPAVVFAAVAHGVVMAAGQQAFAGCVGPVVDAYHVAHRIQPHLVEAAFVHPRLQLFGHGAVRFCQVGHGQLTGFLEAGVAVHRQRFGPVPHPLPACRRDGELVIQPNFCDAVDVAQRLGKLEVGVAGQAALKRRNDLAA